MPDTKERLYFAYGSNINLEQMAYRCPDAVPLGPVTLNGYRLAFRGHAPGHGVATVIPAPTKQVKGLLWKLTPECEASLDRYEGYPHLYYKDDVTVMDKAGNAFTVMAYIMGKEYEQYPAFPSMPYYTGIAEGYKRNGIPLKGLSDAIYACRAEVDAVEAANREKYWGQTEMNVHDARPRKKPSKGKKPKEYER